MSGQWSCVLLLALGLVSTTMAHDPVTTTPKPTSWWCRFKFARCSNNPSTNNVCCPSGGIWGTWRAKTECTDVCGAFGTQTVERTCLTQSTCGACSGQSTKTVRCNPTPCNYPRNSCANGLKAAPRSSQILCIDPTETVEQVQKANCCPSGDFMEWTDWSSCNGAKCGSCSQQTRTRSCALKAYGCACSESEQNEVRTCATGPCSYPQQSCCSGKAKPSNNQILCL